MIHCPDTLAPTNELLLSLVHNEGTLSIQEQAHFETCAICQQRLETYSGMQRALLSTLARRLCPGAGRLSYYCLDLLPAEERTRLAAHLLDCPCCADEVAELRRLQAAFEPFPARASSLADTVRRLFATLVVQQARPVTRGAAVSEGWPRQYQAEALSLSLHLSRQAGGEIMLLGILTSADSRLTVDAFDGVTVDLYNTATLAQATQQRPALTTRVDDIGNLLLAPIPAGSYTLIVRLPDREVVIEDLTVTHG
jgi:hypothetical protein